MGESVFEAEYAPEQIKRYEREILASGECDAFLPMQFIETEAALLVRYDYSGFMRLGSVRLQQVGKVLDCVEQIFQNMRRGSEYLIDPCRIELSDNSVYYSPQTGEIKLAYIPMEQRAENVALQAEKLLSELEKRTESRELAGYSLKLKVLASANASLNEIINKVGEMKREAHLCGFI